MCYSDAKIEIIHISLMLNENCENVGNFVFDEYGGTFSTILLSDKY
jgi:hypothetical protein